MGSVFSKRRRFWRKLVELIKLAGTNLRLSKQRKTGFKEKKTLHVSFTTKRARCVIYFV